MTKMHENEWVPKLAQFLKVPISEPIFKGHPGSDYPWSWTITKWNKGHNPDYEIGNDNYCAINMFNPA